MDCYFVNPHHPNYYPNYAMNMAPPQPSSEFVVSDFLMLDDYDNHYINSYCGGGVDHDHDQYSNNNNKECGSQQSTESSEMATTFSDVTHHGGFNGGGGATSSSNNNYNMKKSKTGSNKGEVSSSSSRIAFRTRSELDVMDDGYKWRKYGKKSVKNTPNLRNYYKCSSEGCGVKKRVERDRDDSSYVITSYDGVHNHPSPFTHPY